MPVDIVRNYEGAFLFKAHDVLLTPGEITVPVNFLVVDNNVVNYMGDNVKVIDLGKDLSSSFYEMIIELF